MSTTHNPGAVLVFLVCGIIGLVLAAAAGCGLLALAAWIHARMSERWTGWQAEAWIRSLTPDEVAEILEPTDGGHL
jgi:hypothetical protein